MQIRIIFQHKNYSPPPYMFHVTLYLRYKPNYQLEFPLFRIAFETEILKSNS